MANKLNLRQLEALLRDGAGILTWHGKAHADPHFAFINEKAQQAARKLVDLLVKRLVDAGEPCDFIALFDYRPATLAFGRAIAGELSKIWRRPVGVLSIGRDSADKWRTIFRYYPDTCSDPQEFGRLSDVDVQSIFRDKRVLLFTDLLRGDDHEGVIRMIQRPAVKRYGVTVIGLAALAICERGSGKRLRAARSNPSFRVFLLVHFREQREDATATSQDATIMSALSSLFDRLFGRSAT